MQDLIPIKDGQIGAELRQTVDARDLHAFLEVGKEFANWIKDRVEQYGFAQDIDYTVFAETGKNGGRPLKQYHLTLDMAKELSMVERNTKGKEARQYFIECERMAKQAPALPSVTDPALAAIVQTVVELDHVKRQQAQQAKQLATLEQRIDLMGSDTGYQTVTAYTRSRGMRLPLSTVRAIGKKASKAASDLGVRLGEVPDERFGSVKSYPIALLDEVFAEYFGATEAA